MSAVFSLSDFAARVLRRPKSEAETACATIRTRLRGRVSESRIAQACARAERLIAADLRPQRAIERVVAWALHADDPPPPQAA